MFKAYYDKKRFRYIHDELQKTGLVSSYRNRELIRKTACLYGPSSNVYIDTSDGVNEDLQIQEYCGRMLKVIQDTAGKPFIFFKAAHSPVWSQAVTELANKNGGQVVPFFKWSFNDKFYAYTWPNRQNIIQKRKHTPTTYDLGFASKLTPYEYPKPDSLDPRVGWPDKQNFSMGNGADTGYYLINSRRAMHEKISSSRFRFFHQEKMDYEDLIAASLSWKAALNPPGMGEYTSRMFDHTSTGQCIILRKNSYDFGHSWKTYLPEIDFGQADWQEQIQSVLDNIEEWNEKALHYFDHYWTPSAIATYFKKQVEAFTI